MQKPLKILSALFAKIPRPKELKARFFEMAQPVIQPVLKHKKRCAIAAGLLTTAYMSVANIGPGEFGLQTTAEFAPKLKGPSISVQVPFIQFTHVYNAAVQSINLKTGGARFLPGYASTKDNNAFMSDMVLNYKLKQDETNIGIWRWSMRPWFMGRDGYWLLTGKMNESANAVLGDKNMAEILSDPKAYVQAYTDDLKSRLEQNNIPVEIISVELKGFKTSIFPARALTYEIVEPK